MAVSQRSLLAAATALAFAAGGARLPAQRPSFLMLQDPARSPVEGAVGLVLADPARQLPALADLADLELFFGHEPAVVASEPSRQTGTLRFGGPGGAPARPGAVLVLGDGKDGGHLAGFVERLLPGGADRLELAHAAMVRCPRAGAEITLFAARLERGTRVVLPALRGAAIPLPPGRYEVWLELDGEFAWLPIDATAGSEVEVAFTGERRELERTADAVVMPAGRADVVLLDDERERCVLRGRAATAPLWVWRPTSGELLDALPPPAERPADQPPASALDLSVRGPGSDAARGFVVTRDTATPERWRLAGVARADAEGHLRLPRPPAPGTDAWLLVLTPDRAPYAAPLNTFEPGGDGAIEPPAGTGFQIDCRLDNGDPGRDVLLEFVPAGLDAATVAVRSDRHGRADFGRVTLPGIVRASDPDFANVELGIDAATGGRSVTLTIGTGAAVRGTVALPGGGAAAGVLVTLRATHGGLRPAERTTVSGDDGSFAFGGLADGQDYVLFARTPIGGRTWSSDVVRVLGGGPAVRLAIADEDPKLEPGR